VEKEDGMSPVPSFYTTDEVAKILHLHPKTVRELLRQRKLKAIKIGSEYRISEDHLLQFIKEHETE
jgi:excisionase family DNA binding protein